ncbi:MAG TPA: hypothetical protein VFD56_06650 [Chitinophagaceae bacterium]|nr:hypothetical protein [Chitinophagaceae bacterium]
MPPIIYQNMYLKNQKSGDNSISEKLKFKALQPEFIACHSQITAFRFLTMESAGDIQNILLNVPGKIVLDVPAHESK